MSPVGYIRNGELLKAAEKTVNPAFLRSGRSVNTANSEKLVVAPKDTFLRLPLEQRWKKALEENNLRGILKLIQEEPKYLDRLSERDKSGRTLIAKLSPGETKATREQYAMLRNMVNGKLAVRAQPRLLEGVQKASGTFRIARQIDTPDPVRTFTVKAKRYQAALENDWERKACPVPGELMPEVAPIRRCLKPVQEKDAVPVVDLQDEWQPMAPPGMGKIEEQYMPGAWRDEWTPKIKEEPDVKPELPANPGLLGTGSALWNRVNRLMGWHPEPCE